MSCHDHPSMELYSVMDGSTSFLPQGAEDIDWWSRLGRGGCWKELHPLLRDGCRHRLGETGSS
jgi:hypothetical protein